MIAREMCEYLMRGRNDRIEGIVESRGEGFLYSLYELNELPVKDNVYAVTVALINTRANGNVMGGVALWASGSQPVGRASAESMPCYLTRLDKCRCCCMLPITEKYVKVIESSG